MKVLIYPHDLGMGGCQLNAIELAARVGDVGAEIMMFGRSGVLCKRVQAPCSALIESSDPPGRPSISIALHLRTSPRGPKNYQLQRSESHLHWNASQRQLLCPA